MNKCINNENARDARLSLATKNPPAVNSRLTWLGKERDAESGLGDHGVRKYDNQTGRFTAPDPLYEKYINWTPYQYAMNNPVSFVDIDGKKIDFSCTYYYMEEKAKSGLATAIEYLKNGGDKSKALAERILELEADDQHSVCIQAFKFGEGHNSANASVTNPVIEWVPNGASREHDGDTFAPITSLIEEFIHYFHDCDDREQTHRLYLQDNAQFDNMEEARTKFEVNDILEEHNDPNRWDSHSATKYQVGGPDEK